MEKQVDKQTELLKEILTKKFRAKQIIIFGSYAHGVPDRESDIDLCVILILKTREK